MKKRILLLLAGCITLPCAAREKAVDTLLYTTPLTATGYTHSGVYCIGKNLPAWEMLTPEEKKQAVVPQPTVVGIGMSAHSYDIIVSKYPRKVISTAWGLSFVHESSKEQMTARQGFGDSILALLPADSIPSNVTLSTVLDYIRFNYEVRVNGMPMFDAQERLPFAINPYIGIRMFLDAGFGSLRTRSSDPRVPTPNTQMDTIFRMFDSTYSPINVDVGVGIPIGVEIFPFSKSSTPVLKNIGVSFTFTLLTRWRVFALPDSSVNPYMNVYNAKRNSSDTTKNDSKTNFGWFGFKKVKTDNEFRFALHYLF
jgi:hypothetical protein